MGSLGFDSLCQNATERERERGEEHEELRDDGRRQRLARPVVGEAQDGDADEAEEQTGDSGGRESLAGEEHPRETGRENGTEADDDRGGGTRGLLLADEQERVIGRYHERAADEDELPLAARLRTPAVGRVHRVGEHQDARHVVANRREQNRGDELQSGPNGHERGPPERGEDDEQQKVSIPAHSTRSRARRGVGFENPLRMPGSVAAFRRGSPRSSLVAERPQHVLPGDDARRVARPLSPVGG